MKYQGLLSGNNKRNGLEEISRSFLQGNLFPIIFPEKKKNVLTFDSKVDNLGEMYSEAEMSWSSPEKSHLED